MDRECGGSGGTRSRLSVKAEVLGLRAQLAFTRFAFLFLKYSPDQPRDERGRWAEGAARHDQAADEDQSDPLGVIVSRPKTGNPDIDVVTDQLLEILDEVNNRVGTGSGAAYGTLVHVEFARAVRAANIPGFGVEESWSLSDIVNYGTAGSRRTDVYLRSGLDGSSGVVAIWDLKTGSAQLTEKRADELRKSVNGGSYIPVIQLHAVEGSSIKSELLNGGSISRHAH